MTAKPLAKISRRVLLISPVVIAVGGFFAVLHGLKPQNATFVLVPSRVFDLRAGLLQFSRGAGQRGAWTRCRSRARDSPACVVTPGERGHRVTADVPAR